MSAGDPPRPLPDTIVALATAPGEAAVGVIRVSGPRAIEIASAIVSLPRRSPLTDAPDRVMQRAALADPDGGTPLDDALVTVMRGPRSYTGEDVVELSCHGSPVVLGALVGLLAARGARLAAPGEFTRRAYLNGRLGLTQAEAVATLIGARTERAARAAARALGGGLADVLGRARERLLDLVAGLEVALDFPDEEIVFAPGEAAKQARALGADLGRLAGRARTGRVLQDGLTIVLTGAPNVGKSSLLNALLGRERAIVSPVPGTTRDLVDATTTLAGVPVRLVDGAGLGPARDAIDAEGMRRARGALDEADLVVVVLDRSRALDGADRDVLAVTARLERLIVANKVDIAVAPGARADALECSALTGAGIDELRERLAAWAGDRARDEGEDGGIVASVRALDRVERARAALVRGGAALGGGLPVEVALVELSAALGALDEALGLHVDDAVLDRIFSAFCVGK